jgi:hypothetical protein
MRSKPTAVKSEAALVETVEIWPRPFGPLRRQSSRKNNSAVEEMCASIEEFGFRMPQCPRSVPILPDPIENNHRTGALWGGW